MKKLITVLACLALCAGCSSFRTTQIDSREDANGEKTTITTKASSFTFFDGKSSLAKWTAKQSASTQSAEVGGLSQESSGSNVVNLVEAIAKGAAQGAANALVPPHR